MARAMARGWGDPVLCSDGGSGRARGAAVLVGDFGRAYLPCDRLIQLASYDVPGQRMLEGSDIKRTTIWALP